MNGKETPLTETLASGRITIRGELQDDGYWHVWLVSGGIDIGVEELRLNQAIEMLAERIGVELDYEQE